MEIRYTDYRETECYDSIKELYSKNEYLRSTCKTLQTISGHLIHEPEPIIKVIEMQKLSMYINLLSPMYKLDNRGKLKQSYIERLPFVPKEELIS